MKSTSHQYCEKKSENEEKTPFLESERYLSFLAESHPTLDLNLHRLPLPSYLAPLDLREPLKPGFWRSSLRFLQYIGPSCFRPQTLFLGSPFEPYEQSHYLPSISESNLVGKIKEIGRQREAELAVLPNVSSGHGDYRAWLRGGFYSLASFPDVILPFEAETFEGYLMNLKGEDRGGMRRNIRKFKKAGHRLERLLSSRGLGEKLFDCYLPFYERARVKWLCHSQEYFEAIADLGEEIILQVARNGKEEIIGFALVFQRGKTFCGGRIGVRPDYYRKDAVYFRLLYSMIESALERGGQSLSLEPTSYRMKRHLGGEMRPLDNLVMPLSSRWKVLFSLFYPLGKKMLEYLEEREELEKF